MKSEAAQRLTRKKKLSYKAFQISTWISVQCTCVASSVPGVLINNDQSRTGAFNRTRPHMAWSFHTTPQRPRTTSAAQAPGGTAAPGSPRKHTRAGKQKWTETLLRTSSTTVFFILFEFFLCFDGGDVKTKAETTAALCDLWVGAEPNVWFTWICRRREEECVFTQGWCVNRRYSARTLL